MAKEKLSAEKSAAIKEMIRLYDIESAKDSGEAFKDMSGPVLQSMLEGEPRIPRDWEGTFGPQAVRKRQRDVSGIEEKVISMYAKGMSTGDISTHLGEIYGIEASAEMISEIMSAS